MRSQAEPDSKKRVSMTSPSRFSTGNHTRLSLSGDLRFHLVRMTERHLNRLGHIVTGPWMNSQGGRWGLKDTRRRTTQSQKEWREFDDGMLPQAHYWVATTTDKNYCFAIVGLHQEKPETQFIHRVFFHPGACVDLQVAVIQASIVEFSALRKQDQFCVCAQACDPTIYRRAGFVCLSEKTQMKRRSSPSRKDQKQRSRPMSLLSRNLRSEAENMIAELKRPSKSAGPKIGEGARPQSAPIR
jgi:hypothetical protein